MDEEADLALLDQHLLKTNLLSQRMTGILGQLDTRLSRLDKTIAPLGLQPLTRKGHNIDAILQLLSPSQPGSKPPPHSRQPSSRSINLPGVKGYSLEPSLTPIGSIPPSGVATPADESALMTRGPDIMALGEYFAAFDSVSGDLERMWKGFKEGRGGAREAGVRDLSQLVEVGFSGMTQLFIKIAKDGLGRVCDPESMISNGVPTPPNYFPPLSTLTPLASFMQKQLFPANPASRVQTVIQPLYQDMLAQFASIRSDWIKRSFGSMLSKLEEVDEGGIWQGGRGREKTQLHGRLWDAMGVVAEAETLLITSLFTNPPPNHLFNSLSAPLASLTSALNPTISTIKRSLSTHVFLAIDLYATLQRCQSQWGGIMSKCLSMTHTPSSPEAKDLQTPLNQSIASLRSLALRSFPEFLVDIKSTAVNGTSSSISDTTHSVLKYLEALPDYEKVVEGLLGKSHSERSWLMGSKEIPSRARSAEEEGGVVNLYVADVLGTLLGHLERRAAGMKRPIGQTFLLNNLSHIRNTTASLKADIVGPGAEDMLNRAFRDAKSQYIAEWSHLTSLLTTSISQSTSRFNVTVPSLPTGERQNLKDHAAAFFDRLSELEGLTSQNPFSRTDPDLRERIGREVEGVVREGYAVFWQKCQGKGVEKYLRGSPDEVRRRISAVFR